MGRTIAVNSNSYHGYSLAEAIRGIKAAGFGYIELTATKGWTEHVFPTMSLRQLWGIKDELKAANLVPFAMSGHTNLMDTGRIDDFVANMRLAAFFGSKYIVSSIGEAHLEDKAVAGDDVVARHVAALVPYLVENDMTLVLENHGEHGTGRRLKSIVDLVGSERVLINYDTANAIFYGDVDIYEDIAACADKIGFMHLKDKAGEPRQWNFPALGKGCINFPEVFKILDEAGNNCPASIEIEFTDKGPGDLAEVDEAVRDSYQYLKSIGMEV